MEYRQLWRFGDDVIDLNQVAALVGRIVYLSDGREIGVGEKAADALRKAIPSYPEPPPGTRDKNVANVEISNTNANDQLETGNIGTGNISTLETLNKECRADNPATCPTHGTPAKAATQKTPTAIREALLKGKLRKITPSEARDLLSEPVTVKNPTGVEFRFTKEKLLGDDSHLKADHSNADFHRRAKVMLYAVDAAKTSRDITNKSSTRPNDLGVYEQRKEVRKTFTDPDDKKKKFEVVVRADKNGEVFDAFDVFPR